MNRNNGKTAAGHGAHRRRHAQMDVTRALMLCAGVCAGFIAADGLMSVFGVYAWMDVWSRLLMQMLLTLLFFGIPAYAGLCVLDGDLTKELGRRALSPAQLRLLAPLGALLVCPASLMQDLQAALLSRFGVPFAASSAPDAAVFLPMIVSSALLAPVCEELFFRGYLRVVLSRAGVSRASVISSLFFALVHGMGVHTPVMFAIGMLLCMIADRTQSLAGAVLVHGAYNLTILLLSFSGLEPFFSGLGFVSCAVRILGCAAFAAVLRRALSARGTSAQFTFGRLTKRQTAALIAGGIAVAVCLILLGRIEAMEVAAK